jgi:hypothetical protein
VGNEERVLTGRYRLVAPLGRGAFSEVWSAEDRVLDRRVAVKLLAVAARQPDMVRRLAREAHALAQITHPHVVSVYDAGLDGLDAYVVMELLAGPSLAEVLAERGPLPVPLALRYAGQAAAALAAAHAIGVVHRDIKPANLVLAADGTVKVVDFGIAALCFGTGRLTATGIGLGTPAYLSPEQAAGRPAEPRSDLYSLGCVLFALLTGEPPFAGEHPVALAQQHLSAAVPSAQARQPAVPAQLDAMLAAMLAKDPKDRPADAATVRDWLTAAESALSSGGTPGALAKVRPEPARHRLASRLRRHRWAPATGGVAVVAALAVLAMSGGSHPAAAPHSATGDKPRPTAVLTDTAGPSPTLIRPQPTATRSDTAGPSPARATRPPATPKQEINAARLAVVRAQNAGMIQPAAATDILNQLNAISTSVAQDNLQDAGHKVAALRQHIADLGQSGQITSAGLAMIQPPLRRLAALLPAQPAKH